MLMHNATKLSESDVKVNYLYYIVSTRLTKKYG